MTISSGELEASGAMENIRSASSIGGNGEGGRMGKVGGTVELGMLGEGKSLSIPGENPGFDHIFSKINSQAFLISGPVEAASGFVEHQAGGEIKYGVSEATNTGQGITAPLDTHAKVFKDGLGAGLGKEIEMG